MRAKLSLISIPLLLAGCATMERAEEPTINPEPQPVMTPVPEPVIEVAAVEVAREPLPPATIEERLLAGFALPACEIHESALDWARWYGSKPDYLARIFKRAEPWLYDIAENLEQRGMPMELALLPIVESAYDPFAYSRGQASGTWQFIASTGKRFGLVQDYWYDGRRDVYSATRAALEYLGYLNEYFDGDWLLALAAYNAGEGRVGRAVKRNRRNGAGTDFWSLRLPRETRGYIPKLLGLKCLFENPEQFAFTFPEIPNVPVVRAVEVADQVDLVVASQLAGIPVDELFRLNAGFNRWATSPTGPHQIILPLAAADAFEKAVENNSVLPLMRWDMVTVESGDTLGKLGQRHGVPVSVLRQANDLNSDLIRVGQRLRLPRDSGDAIDPLYAFAANELSQLQAKLVAPDRVSHRIRSGESLSTIAKRYRVSVSDLKRWNNIRNANRIRAGQTLAVFHSPVAPTQNGNPSRYTVQSGDSLWVIARRMRVPLNDLLRWNNLSSNSILQPGQNLILKP